MPHVECLPADQFRDENGNRAIRIVDGRVTYRGFTIVEKQDFGEHGHLIHGFRVKHGYVVTNGGLCNMMPGATWFQTVNESMEAIDDLIASQGLERVGEHPFWTLNRLRRTAKQRAPELALTLEVLLTAIEDSIDRPITTLNRYITARQQGKKLVDQIDDACDTRDRHGPAGGPFKRIGDRKKGRLGVLPIKQEGAAQ